MLTSHYLFQLLLQNQGVYFRHLLKAVKKKRSQISSFQVTGEAPSLLHAMFPAGSSSLCVTSLARRCMHLLWSPAGCWTLGAPLTPKKPHGTVGVCSGCFCVSKCLVADFRKWFSRCSVKSCVSDPHLTCDLA